MMDNFCKYSETYSAEQKKLIAEEFQRLTGQYYLEHAGATLYSEKQLEENVCQLSKNLYTNPHSRNLSSKLTEDAVDIVRYQILTHFKTNPEEYSVIFTSGATAALKLIAESFSYGTSDGVFAYLQDNHTSVLGMRAHAQSVSCIRIDDAFNLLSKKHEPHPQTKKSCLCNSLYVYPAQSNFSGSKYPLSWIDKVKKGALNAVLESDCQNWFVALDAASYSSTNILDLSLVKPDFVVISFYKIFGYPTGLGALLVKNSSSYLLEKKYYGGGTVFMAQTVENTVIFRDVLHERFEDGTIPFLSILALRSGFNTIKRLNLTFDIISKHTFSLSQYVYRNLLSLHHSNGKPVVVLYHHTTFDSSRDQGGIVNFNILRDNGEYVGYSELLHFSNLYNIHLRTGCFCNPGACQYFLRLSPEDVKKQFDAGHVCGDQHDLVDGQPTGSIRVSFGYMSTKADADELLQMIENCFVTKPLVRKIPQKYDIWQKKYIDRFSHFGNVNFDNDFDNQIQITAKFNNSLTVADNDVTACEGILQQIILYPVKSCGGFSVVDKWPITSTGLKYDRLWMIINSSGVCVTQKHNKKLCLIRPVIDLDNETLILTFSEKSSISIPMNLNKDSRWKLTSLYQSKVCGDKVRGWDCGDEVAEWLSETLDHPGLRLLKQCLGDENIISRSSRQNEQLQLTLANKAQYLLINTSSVEWLRDKINDDEFDEPLETSIQRFRPNFVIRFSSPFAENDYKEIIFDKIKFEAGGVCTRCQMICIDQTTGRASKEPLQTLAKVFKGKISFGIYLNKCDHIPNECLSVGCSVFGVNKEN